MPILSKMVFFLLLMAPAMHLAAAGNSYADVTQQIILQVQERADGTVAGVLQLEGESADVLLSPADGNLLGAATTSSGETYPILARLQDGVFYLKLYEADAQGNVIDSSGVQIDLYPMQSDSGRGGYPHQPGGSQPQAPGYGGQGAMDMGSQLQQYLAGKHFLVSWRDGGAVYGTYTFLHTHYCANGRYAVYANTHKQSVLGGENRSNWEVHGQWQVVNQGGQEGVFYRDNQGGTEFVGMQLTGNGIYVRDGVSVVLQGNAQCY